MAKSVSLNLLDTISIASPCPADWEQMTGDDRSRFCGQCKLSVYNIASMTAAEATELILQKEGHLCVRIYQRADGTILTRDCPVGLRAIRQRTARAFGRVFAAGALLITGGLAVATGNRDDRLPRLRLVRPFSTIRQWLTPQVPITRVPPGGQFLAGSLCLPPRPPIPTTGAKP